MDSWRHSSFFGRKHAMRKMRSNWNRFGLPVFRRSETASRAPPPSTHLKVFYAIYRSRLDFFLLAHGTQSERFPTLSLDAIPARPAFIGRPHAPSHRRPVRIPPARGGRKRIGNRYPGQARRTLWALTGLKLPGRVCAIAPICLPSVRVMVRCFASHVHGWGKLVNTTGSPAGANLSTKDVTRIPESRFFIWICCRCQSSQRLVSFRLTLVVFRPSLSQSLTIC